MVSGLVFEFVRVGGDGWDFVPEQTVCVDLLGDVSAFGMIVI